MLHWGCRRLTPREMKRHGWALLISGLPVLTQGLCIWSQKVPKPEAYQAQRVWNGGLESKQIQSLPFRALRWEGFIRSGAGIYQLEALGTECLPWGLGLDSQRERNSGTIRTQVWLQQAGPASRDTWFLHYAAAG
jgi:hypothetical protein